MTPDNASLARNPLVADWVRFEADGTACIRTGKVELGQGILTALAQIAADELGVPIERIRVDSGSTSGPDEWYTAGSLSVEVSGQALRLAARAARALGPGADLRVPVLDAAAGLPAPQARHVGQPVARIDLPPRLAGSGFIQDFAPPGLLHGRVLRPPTYASRLLHIDRDAARRVAGVIGLVVDGSFVGLVANSDAAAARAARALPKAAQLQWREPGDAITDDPAARIVFDADRSETVCERGAAVGPAALDLVFRRPFIAHASIGTSCAVAWWQGGRLRVWSSSQGVFALRDALAAFFHLAPAEVLVQHLPNAGCYGHNGADDAALDAALLARTCAGHPVRVLWSREDELTWSPFGSAMATRVRARTAADGRLQAMTIDVASGPHGARPGAGGGINLLAAHHVSQALPWPKLPDFPSALGGGSDRNAVPAYELPALRVRRCIVQLAPLRSSSLRALGAHLNVLAIESVMDELAAHANADPVAFRLAHLRGDARATRVLERAAAFVAEASEAANDNDPLSSWGLGFARYKNKGAWCAVVVRIVLAERVEVQRVWAVVDAGLVVNPVGAEQQIVGGAIQALGWTLLEQVRFDGGVASSQDWESYPIPRFADVPPITVEFLPDDGQPSLGVGEASIGPMAAALANAVSRATGVRMTDLPLDRERLLRTLG